MIVCVLLSAPSLQAKPGGTDVVRAESCELPAGIRKSLESTDPSRDLPALQTALMTELHVHPRCGLSWFNLGHVFYLRNDARHAIIAYQRTIDLKSDLAPAAAFYLAKAKRQSGEMTDALVLLANIDQSRLPQSIANDVEVEKQSAYDEAVDRAYLAMKRGEYDEAERMLIAALNVHSSVYTYATLAMALHKQGKWEREQTTLDYARELDLSSEHQRLIRSLQKRLQGVDRFEAERAWHFRLDLATGYDNNVTRVATRRVGSQIYRAYSDVGKSFYVSQFFRSSVNAGLTVDDYQNLRSERYSTAFLSQKNSVYLGEWSLSLTPQMSYEIYGDKPYWFRTGLLAEASYSNNDWSAGVLYEWWRNKSQSDVYANNEGSTQTLSGSIGHKLGESVFASLGLSASEFSIGDDQVLGSYRIPQSFHGFGPSVRAQWTIDPEWSMAFTADYQTRAFARTTLPENKDRVDAVTTYSARLRKQLGDRLGAYFQATSITRTSTMGASSPVDENMGDFTTYLGLTWEPF